MKILQYIALILIGCPGSYTMGLNDGHSDQRVLLNRATLGSLWYAQDVEDPRRTQIRSLDQSSRNGKSQLDNTLESSSCGYHALRNGILCARALLEKDSTYEYLHQLSAYDSAYPLFGFKTSPWRLVVMQQRFKSMARKVFIKCIIDCLKDASDLKGTLGGTDAELDLLVSCIKDIDPHVINYPECWEDGFKYYANKETVYSAITQRIEKIIQQGTSYDYNLHALLKHQNLDTYFDDLSVDFIIDFEGNCYRSEKKDTILDRVQDDLYGKWIKTAEMPFLINNQRSSGLLRSLPHVLVTTYGENCGGYDDNACISDQLVRLCNQLKHSNDDVTAVVLVYLPGNGSVVQKKSCSWGGIFSWFSGSSFASDAREVQQLQNNGHWVSVVIHRVQGALCYYVLDSLNSNRLRNARINSLIDILDGKKTVSHDMLQESQDSFTYLRNAGLHKKMFFLGVTGMLSYAAYRLYYNKQYSSNHS